MPDGGTGVHQDEPDSILYSAFISYNHRDREVARRLQRRIERYRLPRHLQRKGAPARLQPVFRDRDEMTAAPDLDEAVQAALRQSAHLIVVCTPAAAASEWVGREIAYFRRLHGKAGILTALFEGEPNHAFHPALLTRPDVAEAYPLAADFRRGGDGSRLALLKLIAPLAHVRLDELVQRDAQRHIRQVTLVAGSVVIGVVVAAILILLALQARADAERERARSADAMHFQLTDLRRKLSAAGRLDLLATVNNGVERYYAGRNPATLSVPEWLQRAELLLAEAKDDEQRGDYPAAHRQVVQAWRLTAPLAAGYPHDPRILFAHAQSEFFVGFIDWRLGDAGNAKIRFENYAALADRLVEKDPNNPAWRREKAYAASNLGALALRQAIDTTNARRLFEKAQAEFLTIAKENPDDPDIQSEIADGEGWLADVDRIAGNLTSALAHREAQHRIVARQVAIAQRDAHLRVNLIATKLGLARVIAAQGRFPMAFEEFDSAHAMAAELTARDPDNRAFARQMRAIEVFKTETWLSLPHSRQPPFAQIAETLGDCNAEWKKARNDELAALCSIQSLRLEISRGNMRESYNIYSKLASLSVFKSSQLSERWHVNFPQYLSQIHHVEAK